MSNRQYVAVKFRPEDSRTYTYEWDGEPFTIGDEVMVPDNRSDGWKRVTVASFTSEKPPFACKAILGKAPPREPEPVLAHVGETRFGDIDPEELF